MKIKRGKEAALPTLSEGELALATDTKKVYVGTSEGNIVLNEVGASLVNILDGNNTGAVRTTGAKSDYTMGEYAFAEGYKTTASGGYSHAEGYNTTTTKSAAYSHAEGSSTSAQGYGSHAEGFKTKAISNYSHAEGENTTASGMWSHTEGYYTIASADFSHAEGDNTKASGSASHAGGQNTEAKNLERVIGHLNVVSTTAASAFDTLGNAFIIGNGILGTGRSNCFRVQYNGQVFSKGAYSTSGADYAELFEWEDDNPNNEDRRGLMVALHGDKIRVATSADDNIIGIISSNPAVIGNNHSETWQGMYLTDMWGDVLTEHKAFPAEYQTEEYTELDEDGQAVKRTRDILIHEAYETDVPIVNPDYNADKPYIPRHERKEWGLVGMFGQLIVKDDGTCEAGGYCQCVSDGMVGKADKGYYVMKRIANNYVLVLFR